MDQLSFIQEAHNRSRRAGPGLWAAAAMSLSLQVATSLLFRPSGSYSTAWTVGTAFGAVVWPLVAVGVSSLWNQRRSQRTVVKVFTIACLALSALTLLGAMTGRGHWERWLNKENLTAEDFRKQAGKCMRLQDLDCAESNWRDHNRLRPGDPSGLANLGIVLNLRDRHAEAVEQFKKAIALGEGTYDLFAYLADSLAKLGETGQAIEWSYKALSVAPNLVDVRGRLAKLLVGAERPYEAMALLQSYDTQLEARGQPAYFASQRIGIETTIDRPQGASSVEKAVLRLPAYAGHYFAPVAMGGSKPKAFMVDTGATKTTVSEELVRDSRARYRVTHPDVRLTTADGRKVAAQAIVIESMSVGGFRLNEVSAVMCAGCAPLLGQSTLSSFDLKSSREGGMEFLTLVPRSR